MNRLTEKQKNALAVRHKEEELIEKALELVGDKTGMEYSFLGFGNHQTFYNMRTKKRCSLNTLISVLALAGYELTIKKRK